MDHALKLPEEGPGRSHFRVFIEYILVLIIDGEFFAIARFAKFLETQGRRLGN